MYAGIHITFILGALSTGFAYNPPYRESTVSINTKKWLHTVSDKFVSLTIDPEVLIKSENYGKAAINMAKTLSPAHLRVGGPGSDHFSFQSRNEDLDYLSNVTVTASEWILLNELLEDAGLNLIICLNAITRLDGVWDSRNTLQLVSFSDRRGYNMDFELGYESQWTVVEGNSFPGAEMGRDVVRLRKILDAYPRYAQSVVIGPDLTRLSRSEDVAFARNYLTEAGNSLSALTLHPRLSSSLQSDEDPSMEMLQMIAQLETNVWGKDVLARLAGKAPPRKPIWIAESKRKETPPQFKDAINWLRRLGAGAKLGVQVMMAQPHPASFTNPTPDFWMMTLHKALVGRQVLDTKLVSGNKTFVEAYSHCTQTVHHPDTTILDDTLVKYEKGAVTLFGVNMAEEKIRFNIRVNIKEEEIHKYILTEGRDPTTGERTTLFNGQKLSLSPDGEIPILTPKIRKPNRSLALTLPPRAIFFIVIPDIKARTCMLPLNSFLEDAAQLQAKLAVQDDVVEELSEEDRYPASEESSDSEEIFVSFRSPMFADKSLSKLLSHKDKVGKTAKKASDPLNQSEPVVKYITFSDNNWLSDFPKKIELEPEKEEEDDHTSMPMNNPTASYPSYERTPVEAETPATRREKYKIFADAVFGRRNLTSDDLYSESNNLVRSRPRRDMRTRDEVRKEYASAPLQDRHESNSVLKTRLSDGVSRLSQMLDETDKNRVLRLHKEKTQENAAPLFVELEDEEDKPMATNGNYKKFPTALNEVERSGKLKKLNDLKQRIESFKEVVENEHRRKPRSLSLQDEFFLKLLLDLDLYERMENKENSVESASKTKRALPPGSNLLNTLTKMSSGGKSEQKLKVTREEHGGKNLGGRRKRALSPEQKAKLESYLSEVREKYAVRSRNEGKVSKVRPEKVSYARVGSQQNKLSYSRGAQGEEKVGYAKVVPRENRVGYARQASIEPRVGSSRGGVAEKVSHALGVPRQDNLGHAKGMPTEAKVSNAHATFKEDKLGSENEAAKEDEVAYSRNSARDDKLAIAKDAAIEAANSHGKVGHAKVGAAKEDQHEEPEDIPIVSPVKSHHGLEHALEEIGHISREKIMQSVREKADNLIANMRNDEKLEKSESEEAKNSNYVQKSSSKEETLASSKSKSSNEDQKVAAHHHHHHARRPRVRAQNPMGGDKSGSEQKVNSQQPETQVGSNIEQKSGGDQKGAGDHANKLASLHNHVQKTHETETLVGSGSPIVSPIQDQATLAQNAESVPATPSGQDTQLAETTKASRLSKTRRTKREMNSFAESFRYPYPSKNYAEYADSVKKGASWNGIEKLNFEASKIPDREPLYDMEMPPNMHQIYPGYAVKGVPYIKNDVYRSVPSGITTNAIAKMLGVSHRRPYSEDITNQDLTSGEYLHKAGKKSGNTVVVQVFDESGKKIANEVYSSLHNYLYPTNYNKYLAHIPKKPPTLVDDDLLQNLDAKSFEDLPSSSIERTEEKTSEEFAADPDKSFQDLFNVMNKIMAGDVTDETTYSTEIGDFPSSSYESPEMFDESQGEAPQNFLTTNTLSSETSTQSTTASSPTPQVTEISSRLGSVKISSTSDPTTSSCIITTTPSPPTTPYLTAKTTTESSSTISTSKNTEESLSTTATSTTTTEPQSTVLRTTESPPTTTGSSTTQSFGATVTTETTGMLESAEVSPRTESMTTPTPDEVITTSRAPVIFLPYEDDSIGHLLRFKRDLTWIKTNEISSKSDENMSPTTKPDDDLETLTNEVTTRNSAYQKDVKSNTKKNDPLFTSVLQKHYDKMISKPQKFLTTKKMAVAPSVNDLESSFHHTDSVIQKIETKLGKENQKPDEAYASFLVALTNQLTSMINQLQNSFFYKQVVGMWKR